MFLNHYFSICFYALGILFASSRVSVAQVTSDNTVGTQVNINGNVAEITGGETQGNNLFHSFQNFSVSTNNEAFFNNSNDVSNIFSRVTGGNISNIDGAIRANGSASLFLINPAGIVFGENASLNLGGSFYGSTADSILFEDGEFSAANPDAPPLLTINAPIGFSFRNEPADITGRQTTLQVNNGQDLFLVGGNLNFNGLTIGSLGGRVELGSLAGAGAIALDENGNLNFPEAVSRGDISLDSARIVVLGAEGSVKIDARNLSVTSDSSILAGINDDSGLSDAQAGDVLINLTEDLVLDNSNISNSVLEAAGNAGNINIKARDVTFSDGGRIFNINFGGEGNIGDVVIVARDIIFDGTSGAFPSGIVNLFVEEATGNIGQIDLTAQNFSVANGANIISNVIGNSNSGDINLNIADTITIDGFGTTTNADGQLTILPSIISSNAFGNGKSGDINFNTKNLFLSRNGRIEAIAGTGGNGGNIDINAESITISEPGNTELLPSSINVSVNISFIDNDSDTIANSGNVNINTGSLRINDGGNIDASVSDGNGGNIAINAREVSIAGSGTLLTSSGQEVELSSSILADINPGGSGRAGRIEINAASLFIDEGSISADVFGNGDGGAIDLNISELIELSNFSLIDTDVSEGSTGNGGNLNIETRRLILKDASSISASTFGSGNAGNINIVAEELITLSGAIETSRGGIFANALIEDGKGGNVNITTGELTITDEAIITASNFSSRGEASGGAAPGTGEPGNITIAAETLRLSNEGRIEAVTQAETGQGANIDLQVADNIFLTGDSFISAEARGNANGGNLNIDTDFIVAFDGNNDIIASADRGTGGNINITAESLLGIQERPLSPTTNDINASSEFGIDGNVSIGVLDLDSFKGTTELATTIVQSEETVTQTCNGNRATVQSSLVIEGKGGISFSSDLPLDSDDLIIEPHSTSSSLPQPLKTSNGNIQPARGIEVTETGVVLTAYQTDNQGMATQRLTQSNSSCGVRNNRG